jgi:hypothetical protein
MYSFWAPDDGRRICLKRAEHFAEISELYNVASCWLCLRIYIKVWSSIGAERNGRSFYENSSSFFTDLRKATKNDSQEPGPEL